MLLSNRYKLDRQKTIALLESLEGEDRNAVTWYLPSGILTTGIDTMLATVPELSGIPPEVAGLAAQSPNGAVFFWGTQHKYLILPPLPVAEKCINPGFETTLLRSLIGQECTIVLVLIRLGSYAIGVCRGEKLLASKVGTGLVHSRHRQGGSSAARFARHREKQIEGFLTRVCGHIREKLEPYAGNIEYIAYGGARTTILLLQKECSFLQKYDNRVLPPLLTVPDPRQAVLEEAVQQVWSSTVVKWDESGLPEVKTGADDAR